MEAKELRIGNYVFNSAKEICQVSTLSKWKEIHNCSYFQPIPLTEEILLKCGFYKDEIKRQSKQHSAYYSIEFLDYKYSFAYAEFRKNWGFYHSYIDAPNEEDNNKFDFISCGIKYLHQLQNLYFALTNEELIVNL